MLTELIKQLKQLGLPLTYGAWGIGEVPDLPYLVVLELARDDLMADNSRYYKIRNFDIEYYYKKKDPILEERIESFFEQQELPFTPSEDIYLPDEKYYEKIYTVNMGENYGRE